MAAFWLVGHAIAGSSSHNIADAALKTRSREYFGNMERILPIVFASVLLILDAGTRKYHTKLFAPKRVFTFITWPFQSGQLKPNVRPGFEISSGSGAGIARGLLLWLRSPGPDVGATSAGRAFSLAATTTRAFPATYSDSTAG